MTQIQFFRIWWRLRPRNVRRAKWFVAGLRIFETVAAIPWAIRNPRWWWFCRRVRLHYRYGFPMPLKPAHRIEV